LPSAAVIKLKSTRIERIIAATALRTIAEIDQVEPIFRYRVMSHFLYFPTAEAAGEAVRRMRLAAVT
jgi:hypothetical protein